jgi:alkylation response protein AidB-like acyl-CoA dehydrogenase
MDFTLTEEQKQIKVLIKQFCQRELDIKRLKELSDIVTYAKTVEEVRTVKPMLEPYLDKLHEIGLRQLAVPEKYGGGGASFVTMEIAAEEVGYWAPTAEIWELVPLFFMAFGSLANCDNDTFPQEQKDMVFNLVMKNPRTILAASISEAESGTDPHFPYEQGGQVFAHKEGNEWVINGDKGFSTGAPLADIIMVNTRTDKEGPLSKSVTYFLVPRDTPGFSMSLNRVTGPSFLGNGQCHFDNVRISENNLLGNVGKGFNMLDAAIEAKFIIYSTFIGAAQKLYEEVREWAKQRRGGGKPIIEHGNIAERLGQMAIDIDMMRAYALRVAWESDQRLKNGAPINLYRSLGCQVAIKALTWRFCELASDIYGGVAGSPDLPLEGFTRLIYTLRTGGTPGNIQAIKASDVYDDRYNYMITS